jgi:hypothetical protein
MIDCYNSTIVTVCRAVPLFGRRRQFDRIFWRTVKGLIERDAGGLLSLTDRGRAVLRTMLPDL